MNEMERLLKEHRLFTFGCSKTSRLGLAWRLGGQGLDGGGVA